MMLLFIFDNFIHYLHNYLKDQTNTANMTKTSPKSKSSIFLATPLKVALSPISSFTTITPQRFSKNRTSRILSKTAQKRHNHPKKTQNKFYFKFSFRNTKTKRISSPVHHQSPNPHHRHPLTQTLTATTIIAPTLSRI